MPRSFRALALALATSITAAACAGNDPSGAAPTATLSGVIKATTGAVIEGASVTIGSASVTTGTDGRFEQRNLPVGDATISAAAPGYEPRSVTVALSAGMNAHDVVLTPQTPATSQTLYTYQNTVAYLPQGVAEYRAAIVFLPGLRDPATQLPLDSRPLVRGTSELQCSIWCNPSDRAVVRTRALQLLGGNVALIGTTTLEDNPGSYQTLLQALAQLGAQSSHPELANIPIFIVGHSMGGCTAYGFTRVHGARVAGFLTMKGGCHNPGPAGAAAGVPGYFLIGNLDEPHRRQNITGVFEAGRPAGAPWALSIDAFHHGPIVDFDQMFAWIETVLKARLPDAAGAPLRAMTETEGWLGNRATGAISTWACYSSTRSSASWLPSEETALKWQQMAGGTLVVRAC